MIRVIMVKGISRKEEIYMSFDGVFTHTIVKELNQTLQNGRLSKIHQPYEHEIVLVFRNQGKNHKLLLSANPSYARIQLTDISYQNPNNAPNFCMMLRKHLEGGILTAIKQVENDRVIRFSFSKRNELGDLEDIELIVELMGRHSTIVLINKETGKILDCIKHLGPSQNSYRILLPGAAYLEPPQQNQANPFKTTDEKVFELLATAENLTGAYLQQNFQGLGKDTANEIAYRIQQNPQEKLPTWKKFWHQITTNPHPVLTRHAGKEYFTPLVFDSLGDDYDSFASCSELLDGFYGGKAERDRVKQQAGELIRKLENDRKKNLLKLKKLEQTLTDSENAEEFRRNGELLTTFLHQVDRGAEQVTLENYYDENRPLTIRLNPALSPAQNAQKYFQRYQKLKNGVQIVKAQLASAKQEIAYLESVLSQLELASPKDIDVIREELIQGKYIRVRQANHGKKKIAKQSQPEKYRSSDGDSILVGKNNLQNDQLTLKTARKTDIWLHAKDIPGSHVIIQNSNPSEQTLIEAANLAGYFSKFRLSATVPIDYVAVKHVHKPNGAKPGYVIYEKQKTLFVTPDAELVEQLRV